VIDPERGVCKVVLGAVNRGALVMADTAAALNGHATWAERTEEALRAAIARDLTSAGRGTDSCEMKLCETTILRAAESALRS
jgi:CO/xanthine dehydrogenase FAD-binding subunit